MNEHTLKFTLIPRSSVSERVNLRFRQSHYPPLRELEAQDVNGQIVLTGRLPSFYMKQLAQVVAAKVDGVREVDNRTVVCR